MVGTRRLERLLTLAEATGAKVVLVGDPCQLPEIDAGGAFRGLDRRLGASQLRRNRRQTEQWERAALASLRAGSVEEALDTYAAHDRLHTAATNNEARRQLVAAWLDARSHGDEAVMVAARLVDVDDLNRRARDVLQVDGYLGADQVVLDGRPFAEGDDVLALRNDYRIGVLNGTRARIDRVDTSRHQLALTTDDGEQVLLPFAYAEAGHLTHGYATTIHKAQGGTIDRNFVLLDDTVAAEHAYTALSRGRLSNDVFVVASADRRVDVRHAAEVKRDPLDGLRAALQRSARQRLALDQTEPVRRSVGDLRAERQRLQAELADAPLDPSREHRELQEHRRRVESWRDSATLRRDRAEADLGRTRVAGRLIGRRKRGSLEHDLERFNAELEQLNTKVAEIDRRLDDLAPYVARWAAWSEEHADQLHRLDVLDRQISMAEPLNSAITRHVDQRVERGLGIER